MIAAETMALQRADYDMFFKRRKKRKRSKAQRKVRRKKFWKDVGATISAIGGFEQLGSTLDGIAGTKAPEAPIVTTPSTTDSSTTMTMALGDQPNPQAPDQRKQRHKIYLAIGGVVVLIGMISISLYLAGKQASKA